MGLDSGMAPEGGLDAAEGAAEPDAEFASEGGLSEGSAAVDSSGSPPDGSSADAEADAASRVNDDAGVSPAPPRVLPLGDSITQGRGGSEPTLSYRYALFRRLVDEDLAVDFIGSERDGFESSPGWADYMGESFDRDHEGHWGWRLDMLRDALPGWLSGYTPDLVILMGSTNDVGAGEDAATIVQDIRDIVALLRADNPDVVIFWQQPFQPWAPYPDIRMQAEVALRSLDLPTSPVVVVDAPSPWVSDPALAGSDTVDWVHPSALGDDKIAAGLIDALQPWLE